MYLLCKGDLSRNISLATGLFDFWKDIKRLNREDAVKLLKLLWLTD